MYNKENIYKPLQSNLCHCISDRSRFNSYLCHHKADLSYKQTDVVHRTSDHSHFVVAEITFKVAVITTSVVKIAFVGGLGNLNSGCEHFCDGQYHFVVT